MRLLAIEIAEHEVRVARAERSLGSRPGLTLERIPYDGPDGLAAALAAAARPRPDVVLTALPAARVAHRFLVLPFRDRRRLARTAPLELLGQLPLDGEGLAVACEPLGVGPDGTTVLAAAVRRADLDAHAALLAAAGLAAARVDLAPLAVWSLLPAGSDLGLVVADGGRSALVLRRDGRLVGLRALGASAADARALAAEVRWSLAALGGAPPVLVLAGADADAELAATLAEVSEGRIIPFAEAARLGPVRGAEHLAACAVVAGLAAPHPGIALTLGGAPHLARGSFRRAGALAVAALLLVAVDLGLARQHLVRRDAALARAIQLETAAALPGARLVAPRAQLDAALAAATRRAVRLGGMTSPLALLRDLSERVPQTLRLDLDELAIAPDSVLLHGRAESFDAVDALRRALAASPHLSQVTADETRSTVDARRVEFRLRAARRPALGASS